MSAVLIGFGSIVGPWISVNCILSDSPHTLFSCEFSRLTTF